MISRIFLLASFAVYAINGNPLPDGDVNIDPNCGTTIAYTDCVQQNTQAIWRCGINDFPCKCTLTKALYGCYQACPNDAGVQNAAKIVQMQVDQQCLAVQQFASILPFTTSVPNASGTVATVGLPTSANMTKDQFDQLLRYPSPAVRLYNPFIIFTHVIHSAAAGAVYVIGKAVGYTIAGAA